MRHSLHIFLSGERRKKTPKKTPHGSFWIYFLSQTPLSRSFSSNGDWFAHLHHPASAGGWKDAQILEISAQSPIVWPHLCLVHFQCPKEPSQALSQPQPSPHTQNLGAVVVTPLWSGAWAQNGKSILKKTNSSSKQLQDKGVIGAGKCCWVPEISQHTRPVVTWRWSLFLQNKRSLGGSSTALMWEVLTSTTKPPEITTNWICLIPTWNYWINGMTLSDWIHGNSTTRSYLP